MQVIQKDIPSTATIYAKNSFCLGGGGRIKNSFEISKIRFPVFLSVCQQYVQYFLQKIIIKLKTKSYYFIYCVVLTSNTVIKVWRSWN